MLIGLRIYKNVIGMEPILGLIMEYPKFNLIMFGLLKRRVICLEGKSTLDG